VNSVPGQKLVLGRIFMRGFALEGVNRGRLLKAIGLPLALMIACPILAALSGFTSTPRRALMLYYLMLPIVAALAIGVHRVVLMPPVEAFASGEGFSASARRLLQYLVAAVCLLVAFQVVGGLVAKIVLWAMSDSPPRVARAWAMVAGGTVAALALSRFMLILPAIAINVPQPVLSAWRVSRGYGIRIAFVFLAIPWSATALFKHLFPRGTTWPQYIALTVLVALLSIFAFAVISFMCRALTAPEPPPTDPPA
jgi:hypothetical protein